MRPILILVASALVGCNLLPAKLPPPPPAPPAGDAVLLFGREVPATPDAIKAAFADRCPAGTPYFDVVERLNADGITFGHRERQNKKWAYTVSAPLLMTSRWGMIQTVRVRLTEDGGPEEVWIDKAQRLQESEMLAACPDLRRLPGMAREDAEALFRANGFKVRESSTGMAHKSTLLFARRWGEPSSRAVSALLVCRVDGGRIATLTAATDSHPARGFDGLVGMFPDRAAPAADQAKAYAVMPFSLAGMFGLGMLQWMALPLVL